MPGSIIAPFILSAAGIGAKATILGVSAKTAVAAAVNILVSRVVNRVMVNKMIDRQSKGTRVQLPPATNNKLPICYGTSWTKPIITDALISSANNWMWYVCAFSETPGTDCLSGSPSGSISFNRIKWGDNYLIFDSVDKTKVIKMNPTGMPGDSTYDSTKDITNVNNLIYVYRYTNGSNSPQSGTPNTAITVLQDSRIPSANRWTSTDTMTNTAFLIIQVGYSEKYGIVGLEEITAEVINTLTLPGDCIYDYLTNIRYGCALNSSAVDTQSLLDLNDYSEQLISYIPQGGGSPTQTIQRFGINGVVDTANDCFENLQLMADACDSWLQWKETTAQWGVIVNKAYDETAGSQTAQSLNDLFSINDDNIIGSLRLNPIDLNSTYNRIEASYYDSSINDSQLQVFIDLPSDLRNPNEPDNVLTYNLPLTNNNVTAQYISTRRLLQSREDLIVQVTLDFSGIQIDAGDLVRVTNDAFQWTNKVFRVTQVQEIRDESGLYVQLTMTEYNAQIYDNINITEYIPEPNIGITNPNIADTPSAPTITNQVTGVETPSFQINANIPVNGIYSLMEIWISSTTDTQSAYTLYKTLEAPVSDYYSSGATLSYVATGLPSDTYYFKVRVKTATNIYSEYSVASTALVWTPDLTIPTTQISGEIQSAQIANNAVTTTKIDANAVTETKLAVNSVNTAQIIGNAIVESKMAANSVNAAQIIANAVTSDKIFAGSVTPVKLNIAIGGDNLVSNSSFEIDSDNNGIADNWSTYTTGSVTTPTFALNNDRAYGLKSQQISAASIGNTTNDNLGLSQNIVFNTFGSSNVMVSIDAKRITGNVGLVVYADFVYANTVFAGSQSTVYSNISTSWARYTSQWQPPAGAVSMVLYTWIFGNGGTAGAANVLIDGYQLEVGNVATAYAPKADEILASSITSTELANDAVTALKIAANAVTETKIIANAIVEAKIAANAVTENKIIANAVVAEKIAANAVISEKILANAVIADKIAANAVTSDKIIANAVVADKIAANAVTSDKIIANAIVTAKIAAGNITAALMAANSIQANSIEANAVTSVKIAASAITAEKIAIGTLGESTILNPGFETVLSTDSTLAANWIRGFQFASSNTTSFRNTTSANVRAGAASYTLVPGAGLSADVASDPVEAAEGDLWYFSLWARSRGTNAGTSPGFYFRAIGGTTPTNQVDSGTMGIENVVVPTTWTKYEGQYLIPSSIRWLRPQIFVFTPNTGVTIDIDDVEVRRVIGTVQIANGAVIADKVAANAITATKISANAITADKINVGTMATSGILNPGFEDVSSADSTLPGSWIRDPYFGGNATTVFRNTTSANVRAGSASIQIIPGSGGQAGIWSLPIEAAEGDKYYVSCWAKAAGTNAGTSPGFYFRMIGGNTATNYVIDNDNIIGVENVTVPNVWTKYEAQYTVPASRTWIRAQLLVFTQNTGATIFVDDVEVRPLVASNVQIANGTITANKLTVSELSAVSANIGTLRTATTGQRVEIMDNKIYVYDSSNTIRVKIGNVA